MARSVSLAILSDVHFAGPEEQGRAGYQYDGIGNPLQRLALRAYRSLIWLRDPFAHNHLLSRFIAAAGDHDRVVANGDYSCDSGFIGVADEAAFGSARLCLDQLRAAFRDRFQATIGDHEIGKKSMGSGRGGLRLASLARATHELQLQPIWREEIGSYLLLGIASPLAALPVYESETLPGEREQWRHLHRSHLEQIEGVFRSLHPKQRMILFCHDPSALPFLCRQTVIREKLPQVEHTIIGHLHSNLVLRNSRWLTGLPPISFLGHTIRRLSAAMAEARCWRLFNLSLCPSLAGLQLLKDGGYCTLDLHPDDTKPSRLRTHRLPW